MKSKHSVKAEIIIRLRELATALHELGDVTSLVMFR